MGPNIALGFYTMSYEYAKIMSKSLNSLRHVNLGFYDMTYSRTCECTKMQLWALQVMLYIEAYSKYPNI